MAFSRIGHAAYAEDVARKLRAGLTRVEHLRIDAGCGEPQIDTRLAAVRPAVFQHPGILDLNRVDVAKNMVIHRPDPARHPAAPGAEGAAMQ